LGQKQTSRHLQPMSALPPKADIGTWSRDVRFMPKADIKLATLFGIKASPNCDLDYLVHGLAQIRTI
jgi:hypothetical protein